MSGENPADPRPQSQIEAEEGARDGIEYDWSARAGERESADRYAEHGIMGAPGSEVPSGAKSDDAPDEGNEPAKNKAEPEKDGGQ